MNRISKLSRVTRSSRDTTSRIIFEATRLFGAKGYDGVSIQDISEAAGVNIAAVNYHFESKANLFKQIIEQFMSDLLVSARKSLLPPRSADDL